MRTPRRVEKIKNWTSEFVNYLFKEHINNGYRDRMKIRFVMN